MLWPQSLSLSWLNCCNFFSYSFHIWTYAQGRVSRRVKPRPWPALFIWKASGQEANIGKGSLMEVGGLSPWYLVMCQTLCPPEKVALCCLCFHFPDVVTATVPKLWYLPTEVRIMPNFLASELWGSSLMPITVPLEKLNSLTYNTAQCVSNSTSSHLQWDVNSFSVLPVRAVIAVSGAQTSFLFHSMERKQ